MAKRPTESDTSQPRQKKPKFSGFRTSVPRPQGSSQNTTREPRSTSSSTVATLFQSEDGRRRGTWKNRTRQASNPQPSIDPGNPLRVSEPPIDGGSTVDPGEAGLPGPPIDTVDHIQIPKAKWKRNNNTAVSSLHLV